MRGVLEPIPEASSPDKLRETLRTLAEMLGMLYDFDDLRRTQVSVHVGATVVVIARLRFYVDRPVSKGDFAFGKQLVWRMIGGLLVDERVVRGTAVLRFEASFRDATHQRRHDAQRRRNEAFLFAVAVAISATALIMGATGLDARLWDWMEGKPKAQMAAPPFCLLVERPVLGTPRAPRREACLNLW